ncbi:tripartite tricarboxylate transporter substrate binding protein [Anaerosphaera multitolerans]|uniref:Tripartite tricarboxylate transporter substrate binding protein n=1 Tax=Anaerosphaera multitolerans TaxID=2487351 RepID=A0A437S8V5_9FIRM|nr:tripartite tricarboxylate transporter substrate binding protein [Anaerosphaera multitolerans]RVU55540.1 tripartite tricarboxylate transporter substrate binding protein [Anaerosphaera multitolerans]
MKKKLSIIIMCLAFLLIGCSSNNSKENISKEEINWPEKTVEITLPYNAGGDTDLYCRTAAKYLEEELGQTFVIVNKAGGSGIVASKEIMASKPDGYKMLFNHTAALVQETTGLADFSYTDDFANAGTIIEDSTYTLVARADSGWNTLEEMVEEAKESPKKISYSIVHGSVTHYVAEQIEKSAGIELNKLDVGSSSADRTAAFLGGQVDLLVVNYINIADYIEAGTVVPLAILSTERIPTIPDVPTAVEQGYEVVSRKLYEFKFPKDTDQQIVDTFTAALEKISKNEEFQKEVEKFHGQAFYRSPELTSKEDKEQVEDLSKVMGES